LLFPPSLLKVLGRVLGQLVETKGSPAGNEVAETDAGEHEKGEDAQHVDPGAVLLVVVLDAGLGGGHGPGLLLQGPRAAVLDELFFIVVRVELDDAGVRVLLCPDGRRLALADGAAGFGGHGLSLIEKRAA
jgi:hypothetical protein